MDAFALWMAKIQNSGGKGEIILNDFPKYINISETKYYLLVYNSHFDQRV
jgi:hypothetical protein